MKKPSTLIASAFAAPVLALALAVTFAPVPAFATDADVVSAWQQAVNDYYALAPRAYSYAGTDEPVELTNDNVASTSPGSLSYYNLYDLGLVTPAKRQNPWNDCWAFGSIAAAETSLLSKGVSMADADLSERALVNLTYTSAGTAQSVVPNTTAGLAQVGENANPYWASSSASFDRGGRVYYVMSLFSAGLALLPESASPYQNNDGIFVCEITVASTGEKLTKYLTQEQIDAYKAANPEDTLVNTGWAGSYVEEGQSRKTYCDWSSGDSIWTRGSYTLSDANVLPEPRIIEGSGTTAVFKGIDSRAVSAIKSELYAGHGVSAGVCLDDDSDDDHPVTKYFNRYNWSHYTWQKQEPNHRVCIVGWDDDYDTSNFQNSESKTPPGNGAWIVKQSAGAESEDQDFQNRAAWGIVNEDGEHTGYFYLSYYDESLSDLVTFDFDLDATAVADSYADQYDFLTERDALVRSSDEPVSSANIFEAQGDMTLEALMCATYKENTTVTYQVYLLDSEATTPTAAGHSTLACTVEATYPYGGYHRTALAEADQVRMAKGQRYAVVATQKCNDDGKWYQGVTQNLFLYTAKVNAGESFTGATAGTTSAASAETDWSDWKKVEEGVTSVAGNWVVDNAPVKAFSKKATWATADQLTELSQAVTTARAKLAAVKVSSDGTDVDPADTWVTQGQYDAALAAVEHAEALVAQGGDDASGLVDADEVSEAIESLSSFSPQPGTKKDDGKKDDGSDGEDGDSSKDDSDKDGSDKGDSGKDGSDSKADDSSPVDTDKPATIPATGDTVSAAVSTFLVILAGAFFATGRALRFTSSDRH